MHRQASLDKKRELAKKYNLPIDTIDKIIKSQFECVAMVMKSGNRETKEFKTVMLPLFGKFAASDKRIESINLHSERCKQGKLVKNGTTVEHST